MISSYQNNNAKNTTIDNTENILDLSFKQETQQLISWESSEVLVVSI